MCFANGQPLWPAVDLSCAREHDLHVGVITTAGLEQRELGPTIQLKVAMWVQQRVQVAHVTREVEDYVNTADQMVYNILICYVSPNDFHPIRDSMQVKWVGALIRHE